MMPLTTIGPFALSSFGLTVLLAFWLSNETVQRMAKRAGVDRTVGDWLPLVLCLVGLIGARVWYVLFNRDLYIAQPRLIAQLSLSAFGFPGALLAGGSVLFLYARATRRNLLPWLDILAQVLPWGQALGMLGLLLSGEGYGRPTSVPWRIHLLGVDRHPSQVYEALALVLLGLWVWRRAKHTTMSGVSVARYLGGYGAIRLLLEPLRGDSLRLGSLRVAQVVGLILILGSLRWMLSRSAQAALSKPVTSE